MNRKSLLSHIDETLSLLTKTYPHVMVDKTPKFTSMNHQHTYDALTKVRNIIKNIPDNQLSYFSKTPADVQRSLFDAIP